MTKFGVDESKIIDIQGITLKEGIESKYEFQLVKCNLGGYISIRGKDVGAHLTIDDALEFLRRDIKIFMNEPLTTPPEIPRSSSGSGHKSDVRFSDMNRVHHSKAIAHTGRGWTNGEKFGLTVVFVLLALLAFLTTTQHWPYWL